MNGVLAGIGQAKDGFMRFILSLLM